MLDLPRSTDAVQDAYLALRAAQEASGGLPVRTRIEVLKKLRSSLIGRTDEYVAAVSDDFRYRSRHETLLTEISVVVSAIDLALKKLPKWARAERIGLTLPFWPASAQILRQPRGVAGIVGPSNYPVQLTLLPLVSAISAGCRVLLKPSERTPRTAHLIRSHLSACFDPGVAQVVTGDATVGERVASVPFDVLLFTGSHDVGVKIAAKAALHLTPVVLELGGKSPAIVHHSADLASAARKIVAGKLLNAGQTCVAPDYVCVPRDHVDAFIRAACHAAQEMYPDPQLLDFSAILTDAGIGLLQELEAGHQTVPLLSQEVAAPRYRPALVVAPPLESKIMQTEIFGPLLPVLPYDRLDDALRIVRSLPSPLSIYWFGAKGEAYQKMVASTASGAVSVNDVVVHAAVPQLPFGGVGPSGLGRYHGEAGFRTFSNERVVFTQARFSLTGLLRPPFGSRADRILHGLLR